MTRLKRAKLDTNGLSGLGLDKLVEILLEEASANKALKARLEAALAGEAGPAEMARLIDRRLDTHEQAKTRINNARAKADVGGTRGLVDADIDANVGGSRGLNANVGANAGGRGLLGANAGLGLGGTEADPGNPGGGSIGTTARDREILRQFSQLARSERIKLIKRCGGVDSGGYDSGLVGLCRLLQTASR